MKKNILASKGYFIQIFNLTLFYCMTFFFILLMSCHAQAQQDSLDELKDHSFQQVNRRFLLCLQKSPLDLLKEEREYRDEWEAVDHLKRHGTCQGVTHHDDLPGLCYLRRAFMLQTFQDKKEFEDFIAKATPFIKKDEYIKFIYANYYQDPSYCEMILNQKGRSFCRLLFFKNIDEGVKKLNLDYSQASQARSIVYYAHAFRFNNVALCDKIPDTFLKLTCRYLLSPTEDDLEEAVKNFRESFCRKQFVVHLAVAAELDSEAPKDRDFCEEIPDKYYSDADVYSRCAEMVLQAKRFLNAENGYGE